MKLVIPIIKKVLVHLLFWVLVWFFFAYFFSYNSNDTNYIIWLSSFLLPVTATTSYITLYILIPKYLLTKKYWKLALYSFYTVVFTTNSVVLLISGSFVFVSGMNIENMPPMSRNFIFIFILVNLVVGLVSFISLLNHNFKAISQNKELQNKILETQLQIKEQELQFLKKQIHPHFLFNTLNTIYSFALKQSKHTPDIILKLSNLLDYILYQVNKPKVSLRDELLHVKEYIELEKIRFQDTLKLHFDVNKIDQNIQIAPMMLIPFIENAFKHGNIIDGFLTIEIAAEYKNNKLLFSVKNTVIGNYKDSKSQGIGLENIKKRLELHYTGNYKLEVEKYKNYFSINLCITNLNEIDHA